MTASTRLKFARDAVEAAIELLQTLPGSVQREQQREATMRVILKLHVAASRLGRSEK